MGRTSHHSRKKLDLTGQRFGKLAVLGPAENIGNRTAWRCLCECGQEAVIKTNHHRSGHTKICGCVFDQSSGQQPEGKPQFPGAAGRASLTYIDGTCVEMLRTRTVHSNNTSGIPGVDWMARKQRRRASICFKGRRRYLGSYGKFEDAVKARKRAEEDLFEPFFREFAQETAW